MRYNPDTEPLADILSRVTAAGLSEEEAKSDLCHAIARGKIEYWVMVDPADPDYGGHILSHHHVEVPALLAPEDLDWDQSRPRHRWNVGPDQSNPSERYFSMVPWKPRSIVWIELATADVLAIFASSQSKLSSDETKDDEELAVVLLGEILKLEPHLKWKDAFQKCRTKYPQLTERGFHFRVWPKGRELANLEAKAPPGPKPKSSRSPP